MLKKRKCFAQIKQQTLQQDAVSFEEVEMPLIQLILILQVDPQGKSN